MEFWAQKEYRGRPLGLPQLACTSSKLYIQGFCLIFAAWTLGRRYGKIASRHSGKRANQKSGVETETNTLYIQLTSRAHTHTSWVSLSCSLSPPRLLSVKKWGGGEARKTCNLISMCRHAAQKEWLAIFKPFFSPSCSYFSSARDCHLMLVVSTVAIV